MLGDKLQRVENNKSRKRKRDVQSGSGQELSSAKHSKTFRVARDGVEADGEEEVHDHSSRDQAIRDPLASSRPVPEGREWYGWCAKAAEVKLVKCKRCSPTVCEYVRRCFAVDPNFTADEQIAPSTKFFHVFYDGKAWEVNPLKPYTQEVGWHSTLFRMLCVLVLQDIKWYEKEILYQGRDPVPGEPKKICRSQRYSSLCHLAARQNLSPLCCKICSEAGIFQKELFTCLCR